MSDFEPKSASMRDNVASGVAITGLAQAIKLVTQMASVIILSRLLTPKDFGILAMASPFYGLMYLFQDMGLGQAVIQKRTITHTEVNFLFWVNLGVGLALALILLVGSPAVGWFYNDQDVPRLLAAMSLVLFISTAGGLPGAILSRRMQFGYLALIDSGGALVGLLAAAGLGLWLHNYWALFAGMMITACVNTFGTVLAARWTPSWPRFERSMVAMLHFGAGVTGFNIANFVARNLDNALIGKRWGDVPLGLYDRAYKLLLFPLQQVTNPVAKVMVPALARLADQRERYRSAFLRAFGLMLAITMPGIAFMLTSANSLIPFVMGQKWADCVPIFQMLGLAGLVQVVNNPSGWVLIAEGRTRLYALWGLISASTSAVAFIVGLPFGPIGVAKAYALTELCRTPVLWGLITRRGNVDLKSFVGFVLPFAAAAVLDLGALHIAAGIVSPLPPAFALIISATLAYVLFFCVLATTAVGRATLGEAYAHICAFSQKLRRKTLAKPDA